MRSACCAKRFARCRAERNCKCGSALAQRDFHGSQDDSRGYQKRLAASSANTSKYLYGLIRRTRSIACPYSSLVRLRLMASKARTERWTARLAARRLILRWRRAFSRRCIWWPLSATISPTRMRKHFQGRKIDIEGLERAPGKTFFWAGRYCQNLNDRTTLTTELNVFADFKPKLPEKYRKSKYVFLANIAPDLQRYVLQQVTQAAEDRGAGHDELLDRAHQRGTCAKR